MRYRALQVRESGATARKRGFVMRGRDERARAGVGMIGDGRAKRGERRKANRDAASCWLLLCSNRGDVARVWEGKEVSVLQHGGEGLQECREVDGTLVVHSNPLERRRRNGGENGSDCVRGCCCCWSWGGHGGCDEWEDCCALSACNGKDGCDCVQ